MVGVVRLGDVYCNPGIPWLGKTVFCLGSGDSLRRLTAAQWLGVCAMQATGRAIVFAVNSSIKTARLAGCEPAALFFTDTSWYETNEALVRAFGGRVFTVCRVARATNDMLERIEAVQRDTFTVGHPPMRDGRSSGHRAVSVAILCGAARIVLLGYDMRVDPDTGRSHCHDDYSWPQMAGMFTDEFLPGFSGWHRDALAVGCEIVNATAGSVLEEFPKVTLDSVLRGVAHDDLQAIRPDKRAGPV